MDTTAAESLCTAAYAATPPGFKTNRRRCIGAAAWLLGLLALALAIADAQAAVGTSTGNFSVSPTGAAEYRIPITVPPGAAGMAPDLNLVYSSRGPNGLLGVGWRLSGLSSITRCPATLAQDGFIDAVDLDANDRLCLDGQRLVAVSGAYGQSGTEYRTEIETFVKVVQSGALNAANTSFTVYTKPGLILSMGNANGAMHMPGSNIVYVWAVDRIEDTAGNYMTVVYAQDDQTKEHYVTKIEYTGNVNTAVSPYNSVRFEYADRPDSASTYLLGSKITTTKRVSEIVTYAGISPVREYRLGYETGSSRRSRIITITECAANDCLPPTTFEYQDRIPGYSIAQDLAAPVNLIVGHERHAVVADINRDGLPEFVQAHYDGSAFQNSIFANQSGSWTASGEVPRPLFVGNDRRGTMVDISGDGMAELVHSSAQALFNKGVWFLAHWLPASTFDRLEAFPQVLYDDGATRGQFIDLDGDAFIDFVYTPPNSQPVVYLNLPQQGCGSALETQGTCRWIISADYSLPGPLNYGYGSPAVLQDINGDLLPDYVMAKAAPYNYPYQQPDQIATYLNTGNGWERAPSFDLPAPLFDSAGARVATLTDINGDGLADYVCAEVAAYGVDCAHQPSYWGIPSGADSRCGGLLIINQQWHIPYCATFLNTGAGWARSEAHRLPGYIHGGGYRREPGRFVDLDGDGYLDLLRGGKAFRYDPYNDCHADACRWQAVPEYDAPFELASDNYVNGAVADINGDGYPDFMRSRSGLEATTWVTDPTKPDLLIHITNGLSGEIKIDYAPLTDSAVYEVDTNLLEVVPTRNFTSPLRVVSATQTENGLGGFSDVTYKYGGAKFNAHGRGFLGFAWRWSTDASSGIQEKTVYRQDFPYTGMQASVETRYASGQFIAESWNELQTNTLGSGQATRHFPYIAKKTAQVYEGAQVVKTTVVEKAYDNYGNVTELTQTTYPGASPGANFVTATVNLYDNNQAKWHLGRLKRTTVTKTRANGDNATRVSSFAYDQSTGLLTDETIEPGSGFELHTHYAYDAFGNVTITTVSGADIQTRSSSTRYGARGQFPDTTTNALGHVTSYNYSDAHGGLRSQTGPNGLTTTWQYDAFGRAAGQTNPDGTWTQTEYLSNCGVFSCGPLAGAFTIRTTASDGSASSAIFDVREQQIASTAQGFATQETIVVFSEYDGWGRKDRISQPAIGSGATPLADAYSQAPWTDYDYDMLDRPTQIDAPAAGGNRNVTTIDYQGLTTVTINALGQTKTREVNAIGDLVRVTDALGNRTTYQYDPYGNLIQTTDAAGNAVAMGYDIRGHKQWMTDPDMGHWTYDYDVLGQLKSQTDAKGQTVSFLYDKLGRTIQRSEPEGSTTWTYDNDWQGALDQVVAPDTERSHDYDALGRPSTTYRLVDGDTFAITRGYDSQSRLKTLTYPSGFRITHNYTATGYLHAVRNAADNALYWQADAQDAYGAVSLATLGNGLTAMHHRDPGTGAIDAITTGTGLGQVQNLSYQWDALGNLSQRHDNNQSLTETFLYDPLNRLTESKRGGQVNLSVTYDAIGNIQTKSNVGSYQYGNGNAGPHAVTAVTGLRAATYGYDANGNMLWGAGRTLSWTSYNKPSQISATLGTSQFFYGPDRARYKQIASQGLNQQTTVYIAKRYEERRAGTSVVQVHYIHAHGQAVAEVAFGAGGSTTGYLHRDHLGSVTAVTDENGTLVERLSYDAFGKRRRANWSHDPGDLQYTQAHASTRGYTGHEQLDNVKLVHMNGRVYDPILGRFLSADPFVQFPESTQGFNRYTYVYNNPLSLVDPSGFGSLGDFLDDVIEPFADAFIDVLQFLQDNHRIIVAAGIAVLAPYAELGYLGTFGSGFASGMIASGGDLEAGLTGAVTAVAFYGVGEYYGRGVPSAFGDRVGKVVAHGVVGGVSTDLRGGKFGAGFFAAGFTQTASQLGVVDAIGGHSYAGRVGTTAVIGGTAAEIGGGKFANGAVTAAFSYSFNDLAHEAAQARSQEPIRVAAIRACPLGAMSPMCGGGAGGGYGGIPARLPKRLPNKLGPVNEAVAPHSVFRRDPVSGRISNYETYQINPATGKFSPVLRFRGTGGPHGDVNPPLILRPSRGKGIGAPPKVPYRPQRNELPPGY